MADLTAATDTLQKWLRKERVYCGSQFENTAHCSRVSVTQQVCLWYGSRNVRLLDTLHPVKKQKETLMGSLLPSSA